MERELTFVGHLEELRKRIIISLVSLGGACLLSFPFSENILKILKIPANGFVDKLAFFSPQEAFMMYMKISLLVGLIAAFPVIAYQVWAFISPAIEDKLKKRAAYFVSLSSVAFIFGCVFAYFVLLPAALKFLLSFGSEELIPIISANSYISFVVSMILSCGIIFEMPVLSFILTKFGLLNAGILMKKFKAALVVILVAAAIITPTVDAFNMMALAIPMLLLYVISIGISALAKRG